MATKVKAKTKAKATKEEKSAEVQDKPVLDLSDAAIKKMITAAKKRGYITTDALNAAIPSDEVSPDQIEDVMTMLSDMGINVVEEEDLEEESEGGDLVETTGKAVAATKKREPTDRTDDPVRMYLREMGTVELLSREGEIAIAKRIEAGRETMIAGLCENPLTFQALIIWRDELNEGNILLRDIIDLEATYAGPEAKIVPVGHIPPGGQAAAEKAKLAEEEAEKKKAEKKVDPLTGEVLEGQEDEDEEDDDDMEASLSLAAMEAELKPQVFDTLNIIANDYKKLRRLQDQLVEKALGTEGFQLFELPEGQEIEVERFSEFEAAYKHMQDSARFQEEVRNRIEASQKPLLYLEGTTDIDYLTKAGELLGKAELVNEFELVDAVGCPHLNKIWDTYKSHLGAIIQQKWLLLYDCDAGKPSSNNGNLFRRTIAQHPHKITSGIENLFSDDAIQKAIEHKRAFVDVKQEHSFVERGVETIIPEVWKVNKDEKRNLCDWLCENGTAADFENFSVVFEILEEVLGFEVG